jgi:hypothetical protein
MYIVSHKSWNKEERGECPNIERRRALVTVLFVSRLSQKQLKSDVINIVHSSFFLFKMIKMLLKILSSSHNRGSVSLELTVLSYTSVRAAGVQFLQSYNILYRISNLFHEQISRYYSEGASSAWAASCCCWISKVRTWAPLWVECRSEIQTIFMIFFLSIVYLSHYYIIAAEKYNTLLRNTHQY